MASEFLLWLFNTPYYKMEIVKDMEVLDKIIQPVLKPRENESDFIVSMKHKKAWIVLKSHCFRDGKCYKCIGDIDNAIPLIEESRIIESKKLLNGIITKEVSITEVKNNIAINFGKDQTIKRMKEIEISPEFVFKQIEQKIVKDILTDEETKIPTWIILLILGIVGLVFIYFYVFKGSL